MSGGHKVSKDGVNRKHVQANVKERIHRASVLHVKT